MSNTLPSTLMELVELLLEFVGAILESIFG
jgi:hypothetical protein